MPQIDHRYIECVDSPVVSGKSGSNSFALARLCGYPKASKRQKRHQELEGRRVVRRPIRRQNRSSEAKGCLEARGRPGGKRNARLTIKRNNHRNLILGTHAGNTGHHIISTCMPIPHFPASAQTSITDITRHTTHRPLTINT